MEKNLCNPQNVCIIGCLQQQSQQQQILKQTTKTFDNITFPTLTPKRGENIAEAATTNVYTPTAETTERTNNDTNTLQVEGVVRKVKNHVVESLEESKQIRFISNYKAWNV